MKEQRTEILVVGGGTGGVAVALGCRMVLTEETDWIGGQLTSQAVPPDEHRWIESFGCTARYRRFRQGVRELSLSLFYWVQTEAPRPDGGLDFSGLYMGPDTTGTAGLLAAFCLQKKMTPQQVHSERGLVEEFQGLLRTQDVELEWPTTHPV